jgi:hypothetical protein
MGLLFAIWKVTSMMESGAKHYVAAFAKRNGMFAQNVPK